MKQTTYIKIAGILGGLGITLLIAGGSLMFQMTSNTLNNSIMPNTISRGLSTWIMLVGIWIAMTGTMIGLAVAIGDVGEKTCSSEKP